MREGSSAWRPWKGVYGRARRWDDFARFLDDGRICLTNNCAERALLEEAPPRRSCPQ